MNQEEATRTLILSTAASRSHWKFRTVEERYYKYFIQIISCWSYKYFVQSKNAITGEHKFCGLVHLDVTAYCTKFAVICIQFPNSVTPLHSHPPPHLSLVVHIRLTVQNTLDQGGKPVLWGPKKHRLPILHRISKYYVHSGYRRILNYWYIHTAIILEQVQSILVHPFALYTWSTWLTSAPFFKSNSTVGM